MTAEQFKADIEAVSSFVKANDTILPGATAINTSLDRVMAVLENALVAKVIAVVLSHEGL